MIWRIATAAFLTLCLAVIGLQAPSRAQFNGCAAGFCSQVANSNSCSTGDAATVTWCSAVVSAGGTVSTTQATRVNTVITTLKAGVGGSGNVFSICDAIWLMDAENTQQTQISITTGNPAWTVQSGSISLVAAGTKSNVNGVINSGINLSTATNFKRTSGTLLVYITVPDATSLAVPIGASNGTSWAIITNNGVGTGIGSGINVTAGDTGANESSAVANLTIGTRTAAGIGNDPIYYWNLSNPGGLTGGSSGDTDLAPPNLNAYILATGTSGANGWSGTLGVSAICAGVNATQAAAFSSVFNTYETARGNGAY